MILFPFRYLWWLVSSLRRSLGRPPDFVVFILEQDMPALPDPPRPLWQRLTSRPRLSVKDLGERFDAIGKDSRIKGVVLHLRPVGMSMATLQDLRELVGRLRKAGKRVVAWAPFYTTGTYYLACACDEILMMPAGRVQPLGLSRTGFFLAEGLARVGIAADFVQVSPFKSAADPFTKSRMSDELRQQITWLLQSQHDELVRAIVEGRLLDEAGAQRLIDSSPYTDEEVVEKHAVDRILAEDDLPDHLARGGTSKVSIGTWERARRRLRVPPPTLGRGRYVALMRIEGTIIDGRSGGLPVAPPIDIPLVGDSRAGDLTVVQAARQIAADKRAAAVVLYVNSRGGSATASEAMRQALTVIARRKPLVVVMGPVAGSGGYWVSTPGAWIVARPSTLTGSIGVLTGKIVTAGLWSKLLLNRETIAFGERAALESDEHPYTDDEKQVVQADVERIYRVFLGLVSASRGIKTEELEEIASGKVWTGRQAMERKLVDEMGGLEAGVRKARELAGLKEGTPVREPRTPKRTIAPLSPVGAGGWLGYVVQGVNLLRRAPALAVMEYLPGDLT